MQPVDLVHPFNIVRFVDTIGPALMLPMSRSDEDKEALLATACVHFGAWTNASSSWSRANFMVCGQPQAIKCPQ